MGKQLIIKGANFSANAVEKITGGLPVTYQEVEYLKSTGTQYIDTLFDGMSGTYGKAKMELRFMCENTADKVCMGSRKEYNSNAFVISKSDSNTFYFNYNTQYYESNITIENNTMYNVALDKNMCYVNNELVHTFTSSATVTPTTNVHLFMFRLSAGSSTFQYGTYRLYSCKLYNDGVLVRDFIPCYRKADNKTGVYDTVNATFYTDVNGGEFTLGPDVND